MVEFLGDMNTLNEKNSVQQLFAGDKIADYKTIKQLGAAGMWQVYLVENIHMQFLMIGGNENYRLVEIKLKYGVHR